MQVVNRNHIKLRVYERGAGETQACGSGASVQQRLLELCKVYLITKYKLIYLVVACLLSGEGVGSPLLYDWRCDSYL